MARSLNKVLLIGNVGADPEFRTLPSGKRVAQIRLATSRRWTAPDGTPGERTEWHRIVVFEDPGSPFNIVERFVRKGDRLYVEGELQYRQVEEGAQTRYFTDIRARDIILLSPRTEGRDVLGAGPELESVGLEEGSEARSKRLPGSVSDRVREAAPADQEFGREALEEAEDDLPF